MMYGDGFMWSMTSMMLGWTLLTALVVGVAVWAAVRFGPARHDNHAQQILAERYARGELDAEEYSERRRHLG